MRWVEEVLEGRLDEVELEFLLVEVWYSSG